MSRITLALLFLTASLSAQTIVRVTPAAASPGDEVKITGTNLGIASGVTFVATVGGFVGTSTVTATPTLVTATEVRCTVPTMAGFAPLGAFPPGNPVGTVGISVATPNPAGGGNAVVSNLLNFHFLQAEPTLTTVGQGSTQTNQPSLGRPVSSFVIASGAPLLGNSSCVLSCENLIPNSAGLLAVGSPASAPYIGVGDGTLVLDLASPYLVIQPFLSDAAGDILFPAPMPASALGVSFMVQWGAFDPLGSFSISNGLRIDL